MAETYLERKYYNPQSPGSYTSLNNFYQHILDEGNPYHLKKSDVSKWLKGQDTYTLQKSVKRKFRRNKVTVYDIDTQWDADLA